MLSTTFFRGIFYAFDTTIKIKGHIILIVKLLQNYVNACS